MAVAETHPAVAWLWQQAAALPQLAAGSTDRVRLLAWTVAPACGLTAGGEAQPRGACCHHALAVWCVLRCMRVLCKGEERRGCETGGWAAGAMCCGRCRQLLDAVPVGPCAVGCAAASVTIVHVLLNSVVMPHAVLLSDSPQGGVCAWLLALAVSVCRGVTTLTVGVAGVQDDMHMQQERRGCAAVKKLCCCVAARCSRGSLGRLLLHSVAAC